MIKNFLKVAWRYLVKNRMNSIINISGLSIGLTFSLLIFLWVQNELSMDAFHKNAPRLYTIYERQFADNQVQAVYYTAGPLADEMKRVIPEIELSTHLAFKDAYTFQAGDKILKMEGNAAGPDFFRMFSYPLLEGTPQTALQAAESIAVSREMANDFFGSPGAAIGRTIRYENSKNFKITAVFENLPKNVSQKFDFLLNWDAFLSDNPWAKQWSSAGPSTYIMLRPDADPALIEKKIMHFLDNYNKNQNKKTRATELDIQRFDQGYLHANFSNGKPDGGRIEYVRMFSIIALFILLIACINFMNLTTAHSVNRAREIGIRKVVGALRLALIRQFIAESLITVWIAAIFSLVLLTILLPVFNQITQKQIQLPFDHASFWLSLVLITFITGLIAGSYPALFLSSLNPIHVLKGAIRMDTQSSLLRKGLVVFQFTLSVLLITSTIIMAKQINFIQTKNLGYDRENLIYVPLDGELASKYFVFKNEALASPGIQSITRMTNTPTNFYGSTDGAEWVGKDPKAPVFFTQISAGYDLARTMKLKLLEGRDFSTDIPSDTAGYLINEAALKKIGYANPVGQPLTFWGKKGRIIGLVQDFHFASLHDQIAPLIIRFGEKENYGNALIRTQPGKTNEALAGLGKLCRKIDPAFPFTYSFSDAEYQKLYQNEQIIGGLAGAFAFLAIFISSLGLLGLATFTAAQRARELGIRKVLGASVTSLFTLLSSEFLLLVLLAFLIASPLAWYSMNKWLQGYAYHIMLQWWMFVLAAGLIIAIAMATISFQAAKAALVSVVKSLRSE